MAKTASAKQSSPKKSTSLAANRRRRRARANPAPARAASAAANPPALDDFTHVLLPGLGAYAATRVISRLVYQFVQSRWPQLGKHAAALAGAGAFGSVWFFAHKIKALAPYHDGIVMGSFIGAGQGIATCYLPQKYSWLLTDCSPDDVTPIADPNAPVDPNAPGTIDTTSSSSAAAGDEYSYLEDAADQSQPRARKRGRGRRGGVASNMAAAAAPAANAGGGTNTDVQLDPDLVAELSPEESVDDLYSGSFAPN